jgi:hypothetical protein
MRRKRIAELSERFDHLDVSHLLTADNVAPLEIAPDCRSEFVVGRTEHGTIMVIPDHLLSIVQQLLGLRAPKREGRRRCEPPQKNSRPGGRVSEPAA